MHSKDSERSSSWLSWVTLVSVILILFGLLFPSVGCRWDSKTLQANRDCHHLVSALKVYNYEVGSYPHGRHAEVLDMISGNNPRKIPFFEPRLDQLSQSGEYLDPWGSPYRIVISQKYGPRAYSIGKDRVDDGGRPRSDDVTSWRY